jgi:hypothetical protein
LKIERSDAGPFVTVLTLSGPVENGARGELRDRLQDQLLTSKRVVVDLTEAILYDSWPLPLLEESAERFREEGGQLVLVSDENATVEPFVGDRSLPNLRWFTSLDEAMVELLADVTKLAEWPPPASA